VLAEAIELRQVGTTPHEVGFCFRGRFWTHARITKFQGERADYALIKTYPTQTTDGLREASTDGLREAFDRLNALIGSTSAAKAEADDEDEERIDSRHRDKLRQLVCSLNKILRDRGVPLHVLAPAPHWLILVPTIHIQKALELWRQCSHASLTTHKTTTRERGGAEVERAPALVRAVERAVEEIESVKVFGKALRAEARKRNAPPKAVSTISRIASEIRNRPEPPWMAALSAQIDAAIKSAKGKRGVSQRSGPAAALKANTTVPDNGTASTPTKHLWTSGERQRCEQFLRNELPNEIRKPSKIILDKWVKKLEGTLASFRNACRKLGVRFRPQGFHGVWEMWIPKSRS
jgi:hypothetical protein